MITRGRMAQVMLALVICNGGTCDGCPFFIEEECREDITPEETEQMIEKLRKAMEEGK